jgi:threonylcarbamoyladenosine tRNA methylthiotransferase MtaB
MHTVAFRTIGCRTNQQEVCALEAELARQGFLVVADVAEADVVVVNSCCVTATAEAKTRRLIASIARSAPRVRIALIGCVAQRAPQLASRLPSVRWVVGNSHKQMLPQLLAGPEGVYHRDNPNEVPRVVAAPEQTNGSERTRLLVKIQEGCDFRCAYCIVPLVRGGSRSVAAERIVDACRDALRRGVKEIVLTGTHIGQYRDGEGWGLASLLRRLTGLEGAYRIRLSSLDPRDLNDDVLGMVCKSPVVCRHIHLSVQSLSQPVLQSMNRPVADVGKLIRRLGRLRRDIPDLALGGDFIVGFPTESDPMFEETVAGVREAGFTYGHVFRYSRREGTQAADMERTATDADVTRRSECLRAVLGEQSDRFRRAQIGTNHRLVVERTSPAEGVTSNYLRARVPGLRARRNEWLDVCIVNAGRAPRYVCEARVQGDG